jgi:hypothetical protein
MYYPIYTNIWDMPIHSIKLTKIDPGARPIRMNQNEHDSRDVSGDVCSKAGRSP